MKKGKIVSLVLSATIALTPATTLGHGHRTDNSGRHKDNKNKSGLGSYHYHCGGNPPHLHKDGKCPYSSGSSSTKSTSTSKASTSSVKKTSSTSTSDKTAEIKKLQEKLNELGYDRGTPDGKIGKNTTAAIKKFQEDKGLTVDGILGAKTKKESGI